MDLVEVLLLVGVEVPVFSGFTIGGSSTGVALGPAVGSGVLAMDHGSLLAGGAIGLGAFTIARRTLDTVGNDLTDLPPLAALIVEVVAAWLITFPSAIGIPPSLAVSATMSIVGLGWGRANRTTRLAEAATSAVRGEATGPADAGPAVTPRAPADEAPSTPAESMEAVPAIGEKSEAAAGASARRRCSTRPRRAAGSASGSSHPRCQPPAPTWCSRSCLSPETNDPRRGYASR